MAGRSPYHLASTLAFLSAVLHIVVVAVGGLEHLSNMIAGLVIWVLLGLGLRAGWRVVAYLAFVFGMIGMISAMSAALTSFGLVSLALWAIVVVDVVIVLVLFGNLWRRKVVTDAV